MTPREEELSMPSTGLLLLVWQQPSDRALAGWTPYPGLLLETMSEVTLTSWLREKIRITGAEAYDLALLNR